MKPEEAGRIPAAQYSSAYYFKNRMGCSQCGKDPNYNQPEEENDEYVLTFSGEVSRILYHAEGEVRHGGLFSACEVAGMLRDAARMMDIIEARRRERYEAEQEA